MFLFFCLWKQKTPVETIRASLPLKIVSVLYPKGKDRLPTITFQGRALLVPGRLGGANTSRFSRSSPWSEQDGLTCAKRGKQLSTFGFYHWFPDEIRLNQLLWRNPYPPIFGRFFIGWNTAGEPDFGSISSSGSPIDLENCWIFVYSYVDFWWLFRDFHHEKAPNMANVWNLFKENIKSTLPSFLGIFYRVCGADISTQKNARKDWKNWPRRRNTIHQVIFLRIQMITLQETIVSHLGKRKIIHQNCLFWGDMLVPRRLSNLSYMTNKTTTYVFCLLFNLPRSPGPQHPPVSTPK